MAKRRKYEFRPDKPKSSLINRLYLTQKQRKSLLKWGLYGLVLLLLSLLQDTVMYRFRFMGAATDLLPVSILLICVLEGTESGSVFTLIASALYLFSGSAPGAYVMVFLTVLGLAAAMFRQSFLRKGFSAAMLCTGVVTLVYEMAVFAMGLFMGQTILARFSVFLITAGISFLTAPVMYPIFLSIGKIGGETWKE